MCLCVFVLAVSVVVEAAGNTDDDHKPNHTNNQKQRQELERTKIQQINKEISVAVSIWILPS